MLNELRDREVDDVMMSDDLKKEIDSSLILAEKSVMDDTITFKIWGEDLVESAILTNVELLLNDNKVNVTIELDGESTMYDRIVNTWISTGNVFIEILNFNGINVNRMFTIVTMSLDNPKNKSLLSLTFEMYFVKITNHCQSQNFCTCKK